MHVTSFRLPTTGDSVPEAPPSWLDSAYASAFSDSERHFGHIIQTDCWHAYDATHMNATATGLQYLGAFNDRAEAKAAVERATGHQTVFKTLHAGLSIWS
jgi:hypothetical protein